MCVLNFCKKQIGGRKCFNSWILNSHWILLSEKCSKAFSWMVKQRKKMIMKTTWFTKFSCLAMTQSQIVAFIPSEQQYIHTRAHILRCKRTERLSFTHESNGINTGRQTHKYTRTQLHEWFSLLGNYAHNRTFARIKFSRSSNTIKINDYFWCRWWWCWQKEHTVLSLCS